jgi:hypothetical protein
MTPEPIPLGRQGDQLGETPSSTSMRWNRGFPPISQREESEVKLLDSKTR